MRLPPFLLRIAMPPAPVSPLRPEAQAVELAQRELGASLRRSCGGSVDADLTTGFLNDLGLDEFEPLLAQLPRGLVHGATGPPRRGGRSLRPFVAEVADHTAQLTLLPSLLHELIAARAARGHGLIERADDAEVARLVHYSLCLHLVTRAMADDVELLEAVCEQLGASMRSRPRWWSHLTLFEHAKMLTVEITMRKYVAARRSATIPSNFGHLGLPVNILEAVLEDLRLGHADNAYAGLALMRARPGQLGDGASITADERRAVRMNLPVASSWRDLYISWNMAFTANYADSPYFAAAMLNPCVIGAETAEFMYHRALALYVHMAGQIIGRVVADAYDPSVPGQGQRDWRDEGVTVYWGRLNRRAARRYEYRHTLQLRRRGLAGAFHEANARFHATNRGVVMRTRRVYRTAEAQLDEAADELRGQAMLAWAAEGKEAMARAWPRPPSRALTIRR